MTRIVCLGEIMLRLKAPGRERLLQSPVFEASFGGAEANVAIALAGFGCETSFVTALPDNPIAEACVGELRRFGVDTSRIVRKPGRLGVYFLETGANQRSSAVVYDRAGSVISSSTPQTFDWDAVFRDAQEFFVTGITPALSESAADLAIESVRVARKKGIVITCDLNYRKTLWQHTKSAAAVMTEMMRYVDVAIVNGDSCEACLNITCDARDGEPGSMAKSRELSQEVMRAYPQLRSVAITMRDGDSADSNGWAACVRDGSGFYASRYYEVGHIVDRVGAGDAFAAGLIFGRIAGRTAQETLEFATAAGCLKHSIPGDFARLTVAEVDALVHGNNGGRIQR